MQKSDVRHVLARSTNPYSGRSPGSQGSSTLRTPRSALGPRGCSPNTVLRSTMHPGQYNAARPNSAPITKVRNGKTESSPKSKTPLPSPSIVQSNKVYLTPSAAPSASSKGYSPYSPERVASLNAERIKTIKETIPRLPKPLQGSVIKLAELCENPEDQLIVAEEMIQLNRVLMFDHEELAGKDAYSSDFSYLSSDVSYLKELEKIQNITIDILREELSKEENERNQLTIRRRQSLLGTPGEPKTPVNQRIFCLELNAIEHEFVSKTQRINELNEKIKTLTQPNKKIEEKKPASTDQLTAKLKEMTKQRDAALAQLEELTSSREKFLEADALRKELQAVREELEAIKKAYDKIKRTSDITEKRTSSDQSRQAVAKDKLRKENAALSKKYQEHKKIIRGLKVQVENLKHKLSNVENYFQDQLRKLARQNVELKKKLDESCSLEGHLLENSALKQLVKKDLRTTNRSLAEFATNQHAKTLHLGRSEYGKNQSVKNQMALGL